ncbi:hypothetical protein BDQ17DRAFT_1341352 [Cyathus striatus]|nr:hypothetical protein BDQ17DRAFT_1341352 [Cyathus striatus]
MADGSSELSLEDDVFVSRELASSTVRPYSHVPSFTGSPVRKSSPLNPDRNSPTARIRARPHPSDLGYRGSVNHRPASNTIATPTSYTTSRHTPSRLAEEGDWEGTSFSNEYDLSHEDPRILQEVRRAMTMKARREARAKRGSAVSSPTSPIPPSSPKASSSPSNTKSSAVGPDTCISSSMNGSNTSPNGSASEVPHVSNYSAAHPVPSSSDSGMTLDWGPSSEEERHERRWTLTHRKKEKEKFAPLATMSDHQELMHAEKLSRLRGVITPVTARNTSLAREQLARRYALIYGSISSPSFNLLKASRWYRTQDSDVRDSLDKAEPMIWLRHRDKRTAKRKHSPWNMSALIMEEFVHFKVHKDTGSLAHSNEPSSSKTHTEVEVESRNSAESGLSSLRSSASLHVPAIISPATTQSRARELGIPNYKIPGNDTDVSSNRNSLSDQSDIEPPYLLNKSRNNHAKTTNSDTAVQYAPSKKIHGTAATASMSLGYSSDREFLLPNLIPLEKPPGPRSLASDDHALEDSRFGKSHAPNELQSFETQRPREEEEEELRRQYQIKISLLEDAMVHNQRVRQVLNRISAGIKDLETAQRTAEKVIGIPHKRLPQDLVEAFGHDPAAVTGATRNLYGWRAVEDIHHRLVRQRAVFRDFLQKQERISDFKSVLNDPITDLIRSLKTLENSKDQVAIKTEEIAETLTSVQNIHSEVKIAYNSTLSHTSVVYPELSQIVALEESYRDQYQQFWEFGMDALTFLLDTVTPVWRTYGKRIGEDVRDFLIIPLYRNEFTGEARRYPIEEFPKRSVRHWLGLLLFSIGSVTVVILQARAAASSIVHYRLQWIPYEEMRWILLPLFWLGIIVQWLAVVVESLVVFTQVGIVFWWVGWLVGLFT